MIDCTLAAAFAPRETVLVPHSQTILRSIPYPHLEGRYPPFSAVLTRRREGEVPFAWSGKTHSAMGPNFLDRMIHGIGFTRWSRSFRSSFRLRMSRRLGHCRTSARLSWLCDLQPS